MRTPVGPTFIKFVDPSNFEELIIRQLENLCLNLNDITSPTNISEGVYIAGGKKHRRYSLSFQRSKTTELWSILFRETLFPHAEITIWKGSKCFSDSAQSINSKYTNLFIENSLSDIAIVNDSPKSFFEIFLPLKSQEIRVGQKIWIYFFLKLESIPDLKMKMYLGDFRDSSFLAYIGSMISEEVWGEIVRVYSSKKDIKRFLGEIEPVFMKQVDIDRFIYELGKAGIDVKIWMNIEN